MGHMTVWFLFMQLSLAYISGSLPGSMKPEEIEEAEVQMKCWATLAAHITGFAAINAFGTIQQFYFSDSWAVSLGALPIAFGVLYVYQRIFDIIRETVSYTDDGDVDEFEKMWDEETEES